MHPKQGSIKFHCFKKEPTNLDMNKQIKKTPLNCKNTPVYNKIHSDVIPLWL